MEPSKTSKGNSRTTGTEQCYTPRSLARDLTQTLVSWGAPLEATWLEPAAGTGSFIYAMHRVGVQNIYACDIEPKAPRIIKGNFLEENLMGISNAVCLTNPPFGRNNSLSVPFFNKCAQYSNLIAFIVPRSWRKWSVVNRLNPSFFKVVDLDLDLNYTNDLGEPLSKAGILNTVFQVWERRETNRRKFGYVGEPFFDVVSHSDANAALTIFGRTVGTVERGVTFQPNSTKMFIRANRRVVDALEQIDLSCFYEQVAFIEALGVKEIRTALAYYFATGRSLPSNYLRNSSLVRSTRLTIPNHSRVGDFLST